MMPVLLGKTARVMSPHLVTGGSVAMTVTPDCVCETEPTRAAVSVLLPEACASAQAMAHRTLGAGRARLPLDWATIFSSSECR